MTVTNIVTTIYLRRIDMNKKFFLILLCCFLLSIFLLTACNQSDSSQDVGNGENNPNKPVYFTVLFNTLGGSDVSSVTVEKGHKIGEIAPPTKKCSEFVGFALDVAGDEMWDFTSDVVLSDITLYAIWNEKHSWSDWTETTTPTCTEPGEIKRTCEVCGKFEKKILDPIGHSFDKSKWYYDENYHWKKCSECGVESAKSKHTVDSQGKCVCGYEETTPASMFEFASLGDNEWEIVSYTGTRKEVTVPSVYQGGKVTKIGDKAFYQNKTVTSIIIPEGVEYIGETAFVSCTNLATLSIPDSIKYAGADAFGGFTPYIFKYAKYGNAKYIGNSKNPYVICVRAESNITECIVHEDTKILLNGVFGGQKNLSKVSIPDGILYLEDFTLDPIRDTGKLTFNEYDNALYLGNDGNPYLICVKAKNINITNCSIHQNTRFIYTNAFESCREMTSVTIPDSVVSIGRSAFAFCKKLTSIRIPDGVTILKDSTFKNCTDLTNMYIPSSVSTIEKFAFGYCSKLTMLTFGGSKAEWSGVKKDEKWATEVTDDGQWLTVVQQVKCSDGTIYV